VKLPTVLLTVSLIANVALAGAFLARPALAPAALREYFEGTEGNNAEAQRNVSDTERADITARQKAGAAKTSAAPHRSVWSKLDTDDLASFVQRLQAAGFSPNLIRAMLGARIEARYQSQLSALTQARNAEFWKAEGFNGPSNSRVMDQYLQLRRERAKLMRDLLGGANVGATPDTVKGLRHQYGELAPQKIEALQRINEDYAEMMGEVRTATRGILLPEDREKLALLERERRADLAATLSPEELQDYELRSSPVTARLRQALTIMDASEAEFRALFQIQQAHVDAIYPNSVGMGIMPTPADMARRREALAAIAQETKATLGEQRAAEFARASSGEFQQLYRLAQRENLPVEAAVRAYDVRDNAAKQSMAIFEDTARSNDEKRLALQVLAENTKAQLIGALGANSGAAYAQNAQWLTRIQNGGAVSFSENSTTFRNLPGAVGRQPAAPAP
jgi:hypothetical protein